MAAIPASIAIPSTAATLAYLYARWRLAYDWRLMYPLIRGRIRYARRERAGRVNSFYILEEHAQNPKVADKPYLVYGGKSWTFKETYEESLRYAGWLHAKYAVGKGDVVALDFMNCSEYIFLTMAIWSLGATPACVNYNLTGEAFVHSIRTFTARLLIVEPEVEPQVLTEETKAMITDPQFRDDGVPLEVVTLTSEIQKSIEYFPPYRAPDSARTGILSRSPAVLIATSGTTGLPKAAIVQWERMVVGCDVASTWMMLRPVTSSNPDRYYTAMPLYHSSAFLLGFHMCLSAAVTLVIGRKFSVSSFWDDVQEGQATVIQYVGETLRYLLAAPPASNDKTKHNVRMAFGNGLRPDVWDRFRDRFGVETIAEFYGATEGVGATLNFSRNDFASGAIGMTGKLTQLGANFRSASVKVDWDTESPWRDPKTGFCERVPLGQPGEVIFRLDAKDVEAAFRGYLGNPKATEAKVLRNVFEKDDAYYRTGDVMRHDEEGRIWFADRIGDTFRWKSENVSTTEVAEVLGHHPDVLDPNVYGVQIPGHEGRAGCAALLLRDAPESGNISEAALESLATHVTKNLPRYAVPIFIRVVSQLMSTGTNKQQKAVLRKEGVDPSLVGQKDKLYWLRPGSNRYEGFGSKEWDEITAGGVKL